MRCGALAAIMASAWIAPAAAGDSYRWVDADGGVHYGDSVPPEYRGSRHTRLDATGHPIETVESTLEQALAADADDHATGERADAQALPEARSDADLLNMFANERDLRLTRDERLAGLDNRIHWLQRQLTRAERQLAELAADAPPERRNELQHQVERRQVALDEARALKAATAARFEVDLERMRALQGE